MNFRNPFPPGPAVPDPTIFPFSIPRTLDEPDDANRVLPDESDIPPFPLLDPAPHLPQAEVPAPFRGETSRSPAFV